MHGGQNGRDYNFHYAGNITSTTDANGGKITYFYNSIGQVYQVTDQEGASEYFYYDEEGRPETHIDRNGNMETTIITDCSTADLGASTNVFSIRNG